MLVAFVVALTLQGCGHGQSQTQTKARSCDHGCGVTGVKCLQKKVLTDKPASDKRLYQSAELSNGMKVLNIQDEASRTSAFAVAVQAASYDNPDEFPGLAHFCEHMLFLGNAKYPEPEGFDQFVSENGGYDNAYTASEVTNYFQEVSSSASEEGMDRMANFFIHPNFDKKFVEKEVNAINSEHMKNIKNPGWYVNALMNSLAAPGSPVRKFSTGDLETLLFNPRSKGLNAVDALSEWFNKSYCPARMRLVTYGPESLETQLERSLIDFAKLPLGDESCRAGPANHVSPEAWPRDSLGKWLDIQGTLPQGKLWVFFPLPDVRANYASDPLGYLDWVMSYGGSNSLSQVLNDKLGLISGLSLMADQSSAGTGLFIIFTLTPSGSEHPNSVLDIFFAYVASLRREGVNTELYNSLAAKGKLEWTWQESEDASSSASSFSDLMTKVPTEDVLWANDVMKATDPQLVQKLIGLLTPANMNVGVVQPDLKKYALRESLDLKVFPNYNVSFSTRNISEVYPSAAGQWSNWVSGTLDDEALNVEVRKSLNASGIKHSKDLKAPKVPGPIVGVPEDIDLAKMYVKPGYESSRSLDVRLHGDGPERVEDESGSADENWIRTGWVTTSPKAHLKVLLRPLWSEDDPRPGAVDLVRSSLYNKLLSQEMSPKMFDLRAAGGDYDLHVATTGVSFAFKGFVPVMPLLVEATVKGLKDGFDASSPEIASKFKQYKTELEQNLQTYDNMPYAYALEDRNLLLTKDAYSNAEMLDALPGVDLEQTAAFAKDLLSRSHLATTLAMGNVYHDEASKSAYDIVKGIRSVGSGATPIPNDKASVEYFKPVLNMHVPVELRKSSPKQGDPNQVTVVSLYAGVATIQKRVIMNLLGQMLKPTAYGYLRTSLQLGYVVSAGTGLLSNVLYLSVIVQGVAKPPDEMEAHIEYVLTKMFPDRLASLSQSEFQSYKDSVANKMLEKPRTPSAEFSHAWAPVAGEACPQLAEQELKLLNGSFFKTKDPLVKAYNDMVFPKNQLRKKFTVKYFAGRAPPKPNAEAIAASFEKAGISPSSSTMSMLKLEHAKTVIANEANSGVRRGLRKLGEYYPTDLICGRDSSPDDRTAVLRETTTALKKKMVATVLDEQGHTSKLTDDQSSMSLIPLNRHNLLRGRASQQSLKASE